MTITTWHPYTAFREYYDVLSNYEDNLLKAVLYILTCEVY
jgi:hypothetical protein